MPNEVTDRDREIAADCIRRSNGLYAPLGHSNIAHLIAKYRCEVTAEKDREIARLRVLCDRSLAMTEWAKENVVLTPNEEREIEGLHDDLHAALGGDA